MNNTVYIVATPIGNLEDISLRALRVLGEVDFILCEDTRVTRTLLERYKIKTPTIAFHQHSDDRKTSYIMKLLKEEKNLALVTDAGTPGISDPGGKLIQAIIDNFGDTIKIESLPGPSAMTAALSISGIPSDKFIFLGFPPHKKGRQTFIRRIIESDLPVVVYESKHRIIKFLEELVEVNKEIEREIEERKYKNPREKDKELKKIKNLTSIVVCRELTKMHETVYRGDIHSIAKQIQANKDHQKGEFVVIIGK